MRPNPLQLGALPPDSLLLAYSYVAVQFGRAFADLYELGGSALGGRMAWISALGAADFTVSAICVVGQQSVCLSDGWGES